MLAYARVKKLRVLVLCGGRSAERRVSLVSARQVLGSLDRKKYIPEAVFIDERGNWHGVRPEALPESMAAPARPLGAGVARPLARFLSRRRQETVVVFPVLHGPLGEDGTVQGLLELEGLPYVGCGVLGSAAGMDKEATKLFCLQAGIPVLPYAAARSPRQARAEARRLGYPLFVKPARLGSSVGVSKVKRGSELAAALKTAFLYDDKVLLERGIEADEIECALLGDPWSQDPKDPLRLAASVCGQITPNAEFFSYRAKYLDANGARTAIPAEIPEGVARKVRELSLRAFRALDGYAMGRADFLRDKRTGALYFNELNSIPGFTPVSMYPLLWKASEVPIPKLLDRLIALALRRHRARARLKLAP